MHVLIKDIFPIPQGEIFAYERKQRKHIRGFSLIEILVVLVIVAIIALCSVPAYEAIVNSRTFTKGTYDMATFLELARSEAMTRQTYVWVGANATNISGVSTVMIGAVYSRDGTGNNTSPANLAPLGKKMMIPRAILVSWTSLKSATQNLFTNTPTSLEGNTNGISFQVGPTQFASKTLTFTPGGEALLKGGPGPDDGYDPYIDVSFRQTRGLSALPNAEDAAVVVSGATGAVKIVRLP